MLQHDENSNTYLEPEMLTFEEGVLCGNRLQQSGSGSEPNLEPNREFRPAADTMHWWIIMSQNLVTEIMPKLTRSKIGIPIAFDGDMLSKIAICASRLLTMNTPLQFLRLEPIPVLWLAREAICRGKSFWVRQVVIS